LKGKKNLPVQQAAKVQLVLNLKALLHDRRSACSAAPTRSSNKRAAFVALHMSLSGPSRHLSVL